MPTSWTDDRVTLLRKLAGEGFSAGQIAKQLGGVSRNAVISKLNRTGIPGGSKRGVSSYRQEVSVVGKTETRRSSPRKTPEKAAPVTIPAPVTPSKAAAKASMPTAATVAVQPQPERPTFTCRAVPLHEVAENECEFALTPEDHGYSRSQTRYCGNPKAPGRHIYCEGHAKRLAATPRKRMIGSLAEERGSLACYRPGNESSNRP